MKLSLTLLLLFPLAVFARLTTMKHTNMDITDPTATENKNALDLSNGGHVYFEDSMEEHPEMRGLLEEISNDGKHLGNDKEQTQKMRALGHHGKKCYWYHGYKRCYYSHYKKHHY